MYHIKFTTRNQGMSSEGVSTVVGVLLMIVITIVLASVVGLMMQSLLSPVDSAYMMDSHVDVTEITSDGSVTIKYDSSIGFDSIQLDTEDNSYKLDVVNDTITIDNVEENDVISVRGVTESGVSDVTELITIDDIPTENNTDNNTTNTTNHKNCKHKHNLNGQGHQEGNTGHETGQGHQKHC